MNSLSRRQAGTCEKGAKRAPDNRSTWKTALGIFLSCTAVYLLFGYGGIRSPDSEIVYRTARSLAFRGTFAVDRGLESWPGFALVRGRDGKLYALFQPLEPLLLAPWVRVAEPLSETEWARTLFPSPPGSHYVKLDIGVMLGLPPEDPDPHRARALVMPFGAVVSAAAAVFFFLTMYHLAGSRKAAVVSAVAYAFCTLNFPYAGTLFKEPLVNLFVMASFYALVRGGKEDAWSAGCLALSGFVMSLAVATHLMALPMVPFYAAMAGALRYRKTRSWQRAATGVAVWCAGAVPVAVWLAGFNAVRFGSVFNTGYGLAVGQSWWQRFRNPLIGASGLLYSPGKGVFLYAPIILVGIIQWRRLHRACPVLSVGVGLMVAFRFVFAAAYHDWHGGFCIGPRFLVSIVPFMVLPIGLWIRSIAQRPSARSLTVLFLVVWTTMSQQIYFALGEVFSFLHHIKWEAGRAGVDVFEDFLLFFAWPLSPLLHLHEGNRGPYCLQPIPLSNMALWLVLCGVAFLVVLRLTQWVGEGREARTTS